MARLSTFGFLHQLRPPSKLLDYKTKAAFRRLSSPLPISGSQQGLPTGEKCLRVALENSKQEFLYYRAAPLHIYIV